MSLPSTSLAAIFHAPQEPFELREIGIPTPTPGTIVVEVLMCTICGSDLHTYSGRRTVPTPSILGHEMVGRLAWPDKVEDGLGNPVRAGERLIWSLVCSCGQCVFCASGLPQKCVALVKYGHHALSPEWPLSGGLAVHCMLLPGTFFLGLPETVPDALAAPATCATATVAAAIAAAGQVGGKSALIMGAGMLGSTACAMLDAMGAKNILVADTVLERAKAAEKFGARYALNAALETEDFVEAVKECTRGSGPELVFEFAGANAAVHRALRSARTGGKCLLMGCVFPQDALPIAVEDIVRRLLHIQGVHNYAPADLIQALRFVTGDAHRYPLQELVGRSFRLTEVQQAFAAAGATSAPLRVAVRPDQAS